MKLGKISESVLKRSVLRHIKTHRDEVIQGAGIGKDCAFLSWGNQGELANQTAYLTALSTEALTLPVRNAAYLAVMAAANNLAAAGAIPIAVTLSLLFPEETEETELKEAMNQAERCCDRLNIQIVGGHSEVSSAVHTPAITATVIGQVDKTADAKIPIKLDIVASKWIGLEGTSILAKEKEEELCERYPVGLIREAAGFEEYLSVAQEAATALKSGVYAMHDMRNGGVFGALWEISRKLGVGLTIDLKKIPVRQETIEICEFYDLNPYEFLSGGSLLMLTEDGDKLVEELYAAGISSSVIGSTNGGNDKIIQNGDEVRYLEPAVPDEILKISFIKEENK